jgi:lipopolysaccharide/colanic/teichoic acid biosynthesis glycosyltransferase
VIQTPGCQFRSTAKRIGHAPPGFANALNPDHLFEVAFMQVFSLTPESSAVSAPVISITAIPSMLQNAPVRDARIHNPTASRWSLSLSKRMLDLSVALLVLAVFGLPMLAVALCVRLSSPGPAFFPQQRVGRGGRLFRIYKFRSMTFNSGPAGPGLTRNGDRRITAIGRRLRQLKIDELPQFYNILLGEMSLVGPRPKLPQYAGIVNMPYRPGITGAATLVFRREEEILRDIHPSHLDAFYARHIRPLKARIDVRYMCRASFWSDMRLIGATFLACLEPARTPGVLRNVSSINLAFPIHSARKASATESFETAN